jgi:hypothetical protein
MQAFIRHAKRGKAVQVFAASLQDVQKALEVKKDPSPAEIRARLPAPYIDYWDAFAHDQEELPPHGEGLDCRIDLEKRKVSRGFCPETSGESSLGRSKSAFGVQAIQTLNFNLLSSTGSSI